jgi:S-disulfanyl-L-cysteine oxidoreductase SoxD
MKILYRSTLTLTLIAGLFGAVTTSAPPVAAQATKSVAEGVYTDEQASRGAETYRTACASCHMPDLRGEGFAPQLNAEAFALRWEGGKLGDLFKIVKGTMPMDNPNSLKPSEYADVVAFLLKSNGYKAGQQPLADDPAALASITFPKH